MPTKPGQRTSSASDSDCACYASVMSRIVGMAISPPFGSVRASGPVLDSLKSKLAAYLSPRQRVFHGSVPRAQADSRPASVLFPAHNPEQPLATNEIRPVVQAERTPQQCCVRGIVYAQRASDQWCDHSDSARFPILIGAAAMIACTNGRAAKLASRPRGPVDA